jgi:hypothetical protein
MEQLGFQETNFYQILYLNISRKSVVKIQVSLKSGINKYLPANEDRTNRESRNVNIYNSDVVDLPRREHTAIFS